MWHDSERRLAKAVARFEEGDLDAAQAMLRTLDRRGVISPRIDLYLGHCHLERDQLRAAIRRYRRALALAEENGAHGAAPWVGLGLCYGRLGEIDRATRAFLRAESLDPDMEEAHCNLVHCFALGGEVDKAERHAERAVELDPTNPHVFRHLAVAYLIAGRFAQALAAWEQVRLRAPDHPELDVGLGRTYAALDRRDEAWTRYVASLEGPFASDGHYGLGDLLLDEDDAAQAERHYERAVTADPSHEEARARLATCQIESGRLDAAGETLAPLLASWPPSPEVVGLAARVHLERGERRSAFALLRRMVRGEPTRAAVWRVLGEVLLQQERPRPASRAFRRALRIQPRDARHPRLLARALGRAGLRGKAATVLARAAQQMPLESEIHLDLAACQLTRGRSEAAERGLLRGLSWNPESPALWAATAELALERADLSLARARIRSALRRNRRHPAALGLLVRWLAGREEWVRAANAGRAAARVLPDQDLCHRLYGQALVRCGRYQEAQVPLRRYVLAASDDPEGFLALAEALEGAGDVRGAVDQRRLARVVGRLARV